MFGALGCVQDSRETSLQGGAPAAEGEGPGSRGQGLGNSCSSQGLTCNFFFWLRCTACGI